MGPPKISIITPAYNAAPYLRALIESVLQQDYPYYEHIIIDDGSTDDGATVGILKEYSHLRWWSRANKGQYATQNDALAAATGDIVSFISADDMYVATNIFRTVAEYWQTDAGVDVIYGQTLLIDQTGSLLPYIALTGSFAKRVVRSYLLVQHCSLFASRSLIHNHDIWFDPTLRYTGDWDWIIRLLQFSMKTTYLPQPLSCWRIHPQQTSRRALSSVQLDEQAQILARYRGSRWIYWGLKCVTRWRGMAIIGWHVLRTRGFGALLTMGLHRLQGKPAS